MSPTTKLLIKGLWPTERGQAKPIGRKQIETH